MNKDEITKEIRRLEAEYDKLEQENAGQPDTPEMDRLIEEQDSLYKAYAKAD